MLVVVVPFLERTIDGLLHAIGCVYDERRLPFSCAPRRHSFTILRDFTSLCGWVLFDRKNEKKTITKRYFLFFHSMGWMWIDKTTNRDVKLLTAYETFVRSSNTVRGMYD